MIADFIDSPDGLGDGYRVDAGIVIWESSSVLKVPASALFRVGPTWSIFVVENGRTRLVSVEIGHRNASEAEITKGMEVVLHPADLTGGARIVMRRGGQT